MAWTIGQTKSLTWTTEDFYYVDVNDQILPDSIKIEISRDGGGTWTTIVASTLNTGFYPWVITSPASANIIIRFSGVNNTDTVTDTEVFPIVAESVISIPNRKNKITIPSYTDYGNVPNGWFTKTKQADGTDPYANERELFDLWLTEAYNKHGVTLTYYVVSFNLSADKLIGEDNNRSIVRKFDCMSYYSLPREDKLWSKFGLEGMDTFSMFVSKRHFNTASQYDFAQEEPTPSEAYNPKIGDLIRSQYNNYLYEITDVKEEIGMYLLSKQHVWELVVKPFRDEHLSLSPSTSADMVEIVPLINKDDPFNIKEFVEENKDTVNYNPPLTEKTDDSFWT